MEKQLFDNDDSDNEVTFKASSEYAKKYNTLRRKEEWLKLKNKYGDDAVLSEETSSSDEDDNVIFTEEFERDFFKALSCLKKKDPRIYDKNVKFFEVESTERGATEAQTTKKSSKERPMTIRDYNRKIIVEKDGKISDDEENLEDENDDRPVSPSYVQEQQQIKKMFSSAIDEEEDDSAEIGGLFSKKKKSKKEEEEEERSYRDWIAGEVNHLKNDSEENDLKPLKDFWSNPLLEKDEAFLRDYFLNQRFKETSDKDRIPSYDEIVNDSEEHLSEDEKILGEQTEFEHKYNFRFEEPDQEFIKRYPRTLEHSLRPKDDKRAKKRMEVKERKVEEKKRKKEEIAQLKAHKLKEIQQKIEKLKEITGNDQLAFNDEDIEGDFDPEAHDRRMKELFDGEYYVDEADGKKPEFPELDEELGIDNWDAWDPEAPAKDGQTDDAELHCEDDNFNMDCEYDPSKDRQPTLLDELKEATDGRKKRRKRKSKLADVLATKKPVYDPQTTNQTFAQYLDEYYKLDCEDVIGDMPCRFKYRQVPPLDYGLTTAEILMADDDELNRWYPLKKTLQYRDEHKQRNDQKILEAKAKNLKLKMKILPSLFKTQVNEEDDIPAPKDDQVSATKRKRNKKKRKKDKNRTTENGCAVPATQTENVNTIKVKKSSNNTDSIQIVSTDPCEKNSEGVVNPDVIEHKIDTVKKPRKRNKKKKDSESIENNNIHIDEHNNLKNKKRKSTTQEDLVVQEDSPPKKKKKKDVAKEKYSQPSGEINGNKNVGKKNSKRPEKYQNKQNPQKPDPISNLSDERLKAFGLNPKKYRSFMKFKKY